jgi:ubiquinone/menaquinone biosynthesis C-methylase UbiE
MSQYYVDQETIEEMSRLLQQSHFLIQQFGGVLAERPSFAGIERVLDLACGPGQWVDEVARSHPHVELVGMDLSRRMINFAASKAFQDKLENVTFEVGDATQLPLRYAAGSFDLVNISLIYAFMTRELWPKLIAECSRLLAPGGFLRIIQEDANILTNSPALHQFHLLGSLALQREGAGFYSDQLGVIPRLPGMFQKAGFVVQSQLHHLVDVSLGTEGYRLAYTDYKLLLANMRPFLVKWRVATAEEADDCYRRLLQEMRFGIPTQDGERDPFTGLWHFYSIFGQKPAPLLH